MLGQLYLIARKVMIAELPLQGFPLAINYVNPGDNPRKK